MNKKITLVCPCYNEEENVEALVQAFQEIFKDLPQYRYEILFIDNASTDQTPLLLKALAQKHPNVKVIINARNFGHIRSPYYGLLQADGDAVILIATDFQDPPEVIKDFIKKWEEGFPIVMGVKSQSEETPIFFFIRKLYYRIVNSLADISLIKNFTGFGLYDKKIIETLKKIPDCYPYFRGLIAELGFSSAKIHFVQPNRKRGISKNNFYTLYDMAMLGITSHSKIPLRLATLTGFGLSFLSLIVAIGYLIAKIILWDRFSVGIAPLIISLFFFASVLLFFIGILGEYIGSIHTQVLNRPLVIEKERINF